MRKIVLIITICLLAKFVFSQEFHGGIHAGLSMTQVSGDQLGGFDKAGIFGGGFVNLHFLLKSSVQLEINYIQKGSRKNPNADNGDYTKYLLRLHYIEVPLLYKYDLNKWISFEIGAAVAFLAKSTEEDENGESWEPRPFNRYEVSLIGGGYVNFTKNLKLNIRYENTFPFLPIRKHYSEATYRLNKGQYNSLITLILLYEF